MINVLGQAIGTGIVTHMCRDELEDLEKGQKEDLEVNEVEVEKEELVNFEIEDMELVEIRRDPTALGGIDNPTMCHDLDVKEAEDYRIE